MVHWLSLHTANAGNTGLVLGQATKIPHAWQCSPTIRKKKKKKDRKEMLRLEPVLQEVSSTQLWKWFDGIADGICW